MSDLQFVHCKHPLASRGGVVCGSSLCGYTLKEAWESFAAHIAKYHPEVIGAHEDNEECPNTLNQCPRCVAEGPLDAGIPLSVILGRTKLTDHFSQETIDRECGRARNDREVADDDFVDPPKNER